MNNTIFNTKNPLGYTQGIFYYRTLVDQLQEELAAMNEENKQYQGIIKKLDEENKLLRPRLDINSLTPI